MSVVVSEGEWAQFFDYVPWIADDTEGRAAVQIRIDDLGSWEAAALALTRRRLNEMLANPTSFSVPEYSESWSGNIDALKKSIETLEGLVPVEEGGAGLTVGVMTRNGRPGGSR